MLLLPKTWLLSWSRSQPKTKAVTDTRCPSSDAGQSFTPLREGCSRRQGSSLRSSVCLFSGACCPSQQAEPTLDISQLKWARIDFFSLFTELCKTHSWSYSRATSERLREHSPADHLRLWSMVLYSWFFFGGDEGGYLSGFQKLRCFRQLTTFLFVGKENAYPEKNLLAWMQPKYTFCSFYLQILFLRGEAKSRGKNNTPNYKVEVVFIIISNNNFFNSNEKDP